METDYILPKGFLNSSVCIKNIFTSAPTRRRSCPGPRLACGPARRAWATLWWSSRHWSQDPPRLGPPPGALTTDHSPSRSGKQGVKSTVGIFSLFTHLLGNDIRVVMVEDVPLELGHGLLWPPGTGHGEEEEQEELTTGHPYNRPGLTDNNWGPVIRLWRSQVGRLDNETAVRRINFKS